MWRACYENASVPEAQRVNLPAMTETSPLDDAELARAATRDHHAFVTLYDRYVHLIERFVAARTGSSDVEDVVSATFTRALNRIDTFRPDRGSFSAWLFAIARNAAIDQYRDHARSVPFQPTYEVASRAPGPEAVALTNERRREVRAALKELTADQRDALALRYAADLPFAAAAQALGKSEPATKMLVQRGLHALRREFERDKDDG
jgi:RNA polymerase sigma factor (sigma-70 family)